MGAGLSYKTALEIAAHWAAILTGVVARLAYGHFLLVRRNRRVRLEEYLHGQKNAGRDKGQRTVMHLIATLGMTEAEVVDAAFRSRKIRRVVITDDEGRADRLLFEYR